MILPLPRAIDLGETSASGPSEKTFLPRPNIITVVGADAAGKSSVIRRLIELCAHVTRKSVFEAGHFEETNHRLPRIDDMGNAGVLLAEEPTRTAKTAWVRRLPTDPGGALPVEEQARRFSEDRGALYKTTVLPFLARDPGNWVVQDRSVMCSLAYQAERLGGEAGLLSGLEHVSALPGNQLELEHAPRLCLVLSLDVAEAARRLARRGDQLDTFEADRPLQEQAGALYLHPAVHAPFLARGTRIRVIDANRAPEDLLRDVETIVRAELSL